MRAEKGGEEEEESKDEHVEGRRGAEQLGRREMSTSVRLEGRGLGSEGKKKRADKKNVQ